MSQLNLGTRYFAGEGVEKSISKAVYWFRKAAEQNDEKAQFLLARFYYAGQGVEKSISEAIYWARRSCNNFYDEACSFLNMIN